VAQRSLRPQDLDLAKVKSIVDPLIFALPQSAA